MEEFYVCPHCNEKVYGNKKVFANHVRWCKKNPRYEEIRKSTIEKISGEKVKRKEHKCTCEICGKEYTVRITDAYWIKGKYPHTCSKACAKVLTSLKTDKESKNKKISDTLRKERYIKKCKCICCGDEISDCARKYCSFECQQTYQHNEWVKKWKEGNISGTIGKYGISSHIRRYLFEKYNCKCQKCGWGEVNKTSNKIPLQIHHVDGDCLNNNEENLELLCPNCHSLTDTYGNLNETSNRVFRKQKGNI